MITRNRCAYCRRIFHPDPRVKEQSYCHRRSCQRARKTLWQREKMARDPDYKANHNRAQSSWLERNHGYWHRYRENHPQYRDRNRSLQKKRDQKRRLRNLAKMDALKAKKPIETGTYYLFAAHQTDLAKMDAIGQKVQIISRGYPDSEEILQRRTRWTPPPQSP